VVAFFGPDPGRGRPYLEEQAPRYLRLLQVLDFLLGTRPAPSISLVDVGPGLQTELIRAHFPGMRLTTVGFEDHLQPGGAEQHLRYDLNDAYHPESWPQLGRHDVVLLCEVIEHLYTTPVAVLAALGSWLRPDGRLVVQTPNAAALARRVRILLGRPPYGSVSRFGPPGMNPGHFREYTADEMRDAGRQAGLRVQLLEVDNYFARPTLAGRVYNALSGVLPPSFRHGLTVVYGRDAN
jgi:Methyltransferase domain